MYRNILIPIVFDELHDTNAAYLVARALADDDAKFTVLHVMEPIPDFVVHEIPAEVMAGSRTRLEGKLKSSAQALPGAEVALITGHPGRAIVDYATENNVDCVVIASHVPGFENIFLGSTADRVVRHAKCAVHVIR